MCIEELITGRSSIGKWGNAGGRLNWSVRIPSAGTYRVSGLFSADKQAGMLLQLGNSRLRFNVPAFGDWNKPQRVNIGQVSFEHAGVYPVVLSVADRANYSGVNMWRIDIRHD